MKIKECTNVQIDIQKAPTRKKRDLILNEPTTISKLIQDLGGKFNKFSTGTEPLSYVLKSVFSKRPYGINFNSIIYKEDLYEYICEQVILKKAVILCGPERLEVETVKTDFGQFYKNAVILFLNEQLVLSIEQDYNSIDQIMYGLSSDGINAKLSEISDYCFKHAVHKGKCFDLKGTQKIDITTPDLELPATIMDKLLLNTKVFFDNLDLLRDNGLKQQRGLILFGSPGNGKTSICKYLCSQLPNVTRIWASPSSISRVDDITTLFKVARELAPTIIFMEDIESICEERERQLNNPFLGELLNQLDGPVENKGVVVIATTNFIQYLDKAISYRPGRFDEKLEIKSRFKSMSMAEHYVKQDREKFYKLLQDKGIKINSSSKTTTKSVESFEPSTEPYIG